MPIIGYLDSGSAERNWAESFRHGLNETGYVEGKNVTIEYRWADGKYDRLPMLAADLVQRNVAVIAATSTPPALAAQKATSTIPIVFTTGSDPVRFGLVANLSHPGGNVTGVTRLNLALEAKRLQLLHELLPSAHTIALLVNPTNPNSKIISSDVQAEGNRLGINIEIVRAITESDIDQVFTALYQTGVGALLIGPDPFFNSRSQLIANLMLRYAVPTMFQYQEYVEAGGLLSYSASLADSHRQVGIYVGKSSQGPSRAISQSNSRDDSN